MAQKLQQYCNKQSQEPAFQSSGDDVIDDIVNDLEMECGYSIDPSIFAL